MKRGQITIFIILGIVILLVVGLFLFLAQPQEKETYQQPNLALSEFVQSCLDDAATEAVLLAAAKGGYIFNEPIPGWIALDELDVHFGYYAGFDLLPTIEQLEAQLESYVNQRIENCVTFETFPNAEAVSAPTSVAVIGDESVTVALEYPIAVASAERVETLQDFRTTVEQPLGIMTEKAHEVIATLVETEGAFEMIQLDELPWEYDILPMAFDQQLVLFLKEDFVYMFGVLHFLNHRPEIIKDLPLPIPFGETSRIPIRYIDLDNDVVSFRSSMGTIDNEGVLYFTPPSIGMFNVIVTITDATGLDDTYVYPIEVRR